MSGKIRNPARRCKICGNKREADYAREAYESALKAEREALREQYEAGALVDGARGDCAKLREAVIGLRDRISMFYKNEWIPYDEWEGANDDANSALAAPPRNCDVYNNESCRMAYHLHGDGLMTMQAFADWLYAPAAEKEGGAK